MVDEGELNRGDRQTYWQQQYLDARAAGNRDMKSILAHMRGNGGEGGTTGHDITRPAAADIVRAQEQRHGAKPPGKPPTGGQAVQGGEEPRRGQVDRSQVKHILKHELHTADRLADLGENVTFVPTSDSPRPDAVLSDGRSWEFKSPAGSNRNTILTKIRDAADRGKENFVLDMSRSAMPLDQVRDLARYAVDNYPGVQNIRLIGRETADGLLDNMVTKGGE